MTAGRIEIALGGPGMTAFHRAGLAGLYMTLEALNKDKKVKELLSRAGGTWKLQDDRVILEWRDKPRRFFQILTRESFKINKGLIWFPAFGDPSKNIGAAAALNECLLGTILQHGQNRRADPAGKPGGSFVETIDEKEFPRSYRRITYYQHQDDYQHQDEMVSEPTVSYAVKGMLYPGGSVRHWAIKNTGLVEPLERYLALLYGIVGVFYFAIRNMARQESAQYALVMPQIKNLHEYSRLRTVFAGKTKSDITVSGAGEAALRLLSEIHANKTMRELGSAACRVITFGKKPWNKQGKVRTEVFDVVKDDIKDILIYKRCMQIFKPKLLKSASGSHYWDYPQIPEMVARNVLLGHKWWEGFADLISDQKIGDHVMGTSNNALYHGERRELAKMLGSADASFSNAERVFVEACHEAWRRKLGMLGERSRDENISFDDLVRREFVRTRTSFSKCKNPQTLRETVTAFWAQSGSPISSLQSGWGDAIHFVEHDWRAARDLALLSLASYRKKDEGNPLND